MHTAYPQAESACSPRVPVAVRLDAAVIAQLDARCKRQKISRSTYLRQLITSDLKIQKGVMHEHA